MNAVTYVLINTDANSAAEMRIKINGLLTLDVLDFIL